MNKPSVEVLYDRNEGEMIAKLMVMLLVLFSGIYVQNKTHVAWQYVDGQPGGIYAGGFLSCNDALYSIGGSSSSGPICNNYQYDPATHQWIKKAPLHIAHKNAAYVSVNGKIHVIAGDPFLDVHEVYDPIKDKWSPLASIPTNVQHVMGVAVGGKIYVMGGLETWNDVSNKNQVYDIKTDTWMEMAPMPIGKHGYSSIVHQNKIYVFGSLAKDPTGDKNIYGSNTAIDVYDTMTNTWTSIGNMPTDLYLGAIVVYGDEVIIIGGFREADQPKASVDIFSLTTQTWRKALPIPEAFVGMGAVIYNDQLYVSGGAKPLNNWTTNQKLYHIPIKKLLGNMD